MNFPKDGVYFLSRNEMKMLLSAEGMNIKNTEHLITKGYEFRVSLRTDSNGKRHLSIIAVNE